jgi:hypothetical protein
MMRKVFSVALMATLACAFGLVQSANAGVTIDLHFQDVTIPTGITILQGDAGPGCDFGGYGGGSTATGYCMDVILKSTFKMVALGTSVTYSSNHGLAIQAMYEWVGPNVTKALKCAPPGGLVDKGGVIESFDCLVAPPNNPPALTPGTYRIGTIVWDTSMTDGSPGQQVETVAAYINDLFNGVSANVNGNLITLRAADIVVGSHLVTIIPEPGTAALLGLGLVGLILAGRRRRA